MKEKRYFYNDQISVGDKILIKDEEFHHLSNVMRSKTGESVCLFNGDGNFYFGTITQIAKKYAEILIDRSEVSENEPSVQIDVFQALAKGDKLSLIMQKITELGASNLFLFESTFCDVKSNTHKQERLETVSVSAAKQCGRASIVNCDSEILNIKTVANMITDYDKFFVAYENEDGTTLVDAVLANKDNIKKVAFMIGAEGGFAEKEIEQLKEAGASIVSLGKRILRTETASIACTSVLSQILKA